MVLVKLIFGNISLGNFHAETTEEAEKALKEKGFRLLGTLHWTRTDEDAIITPLRPISNLPPKN